MKTILKKMYWWLIYTVSNLRFVIISRKEYLSLRDKAAELDLKLTELKILQSKYAFVVQCEKDGCAINDSIIKINDALNAKISELEKIAANHAHKKELEKARKQRYEAKKKLQKRETIDHLAVSDPVEQVTGISEAEKFARENLGRKVTLKPETGKGGATGFISGYSSNSEIYVLVGFDIIGGWRISEHYKHVVALANHKSYWFVKIDEIVFN